MAACLSFAELLPPGQAVPMTVPRMSHAGLRRLGKRVLFSAVAAVVGLVAGCRHSVPPEALADWHGWQAQRLESVAGTNGWASLVGLHWLPEGPSTSGARADQSHRFPEGRAPEVVGVWHRNGPEVRLEPAPGVVVFKNGQPFQGGALVTDAHGAKPDGISVGGLRITVIDRGGRLGLRVKDSLAPTRRGLHRSPSLPLVSPLGSSGPLGARGSGCHVDHGHRHRESGIHALGRDFDLRDRR